MLRRINVNEDRNIIKVKIEPDPVGLAPPFEFGAPRRYRQWRPGQWGAVEAGLLVEKRALLQCAPTGFGKSFMYVMQAVMSGMRTWVLTSTKGLQEQLGKDFREIGMVDIRGMNNYDCLETFQFGKKVRCDEGGCHAGYRCGLRNGGCEFYDAQRTAGNANLVVTNYDYWLTINQNHPESVGPVDLLVMDEAHDALERLTNHLHVELHEHEAEGLLESRLPEPGTGIREVKDWANYHLPIVENRIVRLKAEVLAGVAPGGAIYEVKAYKGLLKKLKLLGGAKGEWVDEHKGKTVTWDPVRPSEYAEEMLFCGVPKLVLVSANLRPRDAQLLNLKEEDYEFREYPSSFPAYRRPIIHVPTVWLNRHTKPPEIRKWLTRIDQLVGPRISEKGMIHTISYSRRNEVTANSQYRMDMITHETRDVMKRVKEFRESPPPAVMVTPSMETGWDFPYEELRWQIIGKVPFPDTSTVIMKARLKTDPDYASYQAAQRLVQMCGRGMRAADDLFETLVIDDTFQKFVRQYRRFLPGWWLEAVQWAKVNPQPLMDNPMMWRK